jgi:hypothetical protein
MLQTAWHGNQTEVRRLVAGIERNRNRLVFFGRIRERVSSDEWIAQDDEVYR